MWESYRDLPDDGRVAWYGNVDGVVGNGVDEMAETRLVVQERIRQAIVLLRGHRVMLDADLSILYQVETKALIRAVKRNRARFPADFMFQLTDEELEILRRQFGTSSGWGGRRHLPYAFTEHGVAMLSSVLRSPRAVQVNIEIMRTFVRIRQMVKSNAVLAKRLAALEQKYDGQFRIVFEALRELVVPPGKPRKRIGFR